MTDKIARAEISERIEEAHDTLKRLPDKDRKTLQTQGQTWPTMLRTAAEHAAWKASKMKRPPPTAAQITRMYEVLDWLLALAKLDRDYLKAVWLCCAENREVAYVAKLLGKDRGTVRIWRDNGLDRIVGLRAVPTIASMKLRDSLMEGLHHPKRNVG